MLAENLTNEIVSPFGTAMPLGFATPGAYNQGSNVPEGRTFTVQARFNFKPAGGTIN